MRNGTLSNNVEGRFLVLWDGLMAELPDDAARRRFKTFSALGRRERALAQWKSIPIARAALTDLAYRRSTPVDLVTFLPEEYLIKLEKRAERDALPVTHVLAHTEESLDEYSRTIPFVIGVIHPFINRPFLFGKKGIPVMPGQPWPLW